MDAGESLDREVVVERAEALRSWLAGLSLPGRTMGALNRELAGIIENDPGGYIDGRRPLAGLTVAEFVAELGRPGAGVVGSVRSVGETAIRDLRAAVSPGGPDAPPPGWQEYTGGADEAAPPESHNGAAKPRRPRARKPAPDAAPETGSLAATEQVAAELSNGVSPEAPAVPKRRGRPPRQALAPLAALAPVPAQPVAVAPAAPTDPTLEQLARLWPSLHPQARRAVVLYTSTLLAEAPYSK